MTGSYFLLQLRISYTVKRLTKNSMNINMSVKAKYYVSRQPFAHVALLTMYVHASRVITILWMVAIYYITHVIPCTML